MELKHKTALVTGACGGIGRAVVAALVAQGARVVAFDRDIEAVAALAEGFGGACDPVAVDLGDATALQAVMKDVANRFEVIDILVNNAGVLSPHKLGATTLDDWHRLMAVNLDAALLLTQAVVPAMKENRWGRLINISSYAWKSGGLTAGTAYSVSKSALVGLTYSSARELAPFGVTANAVAPTSCGFADDHGATVRGRSPAPACGHSRRAVLPAGRGGPYRTFPRLAAVRLHDRHCR